MTRKEDRPTIDQDPAPLSHDRPARGEDEATVLARDLALARIRIAALERRNAALRDANAQAVQSIPHRLGLALIEARNSWRGALRFPAAVRRIRREADALRRQQAEREEAAILLPRRDPDRLPPPLADLPETLRQLRVACVMDDFTHHAFAPECTLLALDPDAWEEQLVAFRPHLLFIESAWRGAESGWRHKVSRPSREIMGAIDWCARNGVPSVFWGKEDPVHFEGFLPIARAVDHVFTTDIDCIARYRAAIGHDRVYLLPFAAQPAMHNPIEEVPREAGFCFAGSYYLKYPERQRDFATLIDLLVPRGPVAIFDRNFDAPNANLEYPERYRPLVLGGLPFSQIDRAYKGYRHGVNLNTIKQSQTMCARRVFELLASNSVVVSNFSRAMRVLFGDLVISSDAPAEVARRLDWLGADEHRLDRFRLAGLRKVMAEHCYADRLAHVVSRVSGREVRAPLPDIEIVAWPADAQEVDRLMAMFAAQHHPAKRLLLVSDQSLGQALAEGVRVLSPADTPGLRASLAAAEWVAHWDGRDHYGPHYLTDLALATRYVDSGIIGKAAHFAVVDGGITLRRGAARYRGVDRLESRASLMRGSLAAELLAGGGTDLAGQAMLAIDPFNYCRDGRDADLADLAAVTGDLDGLWTGLSLSRDVMRQAETLFRDAAPPPAGGEPFAIDAPALARTIGRRSWGLGARLAEGGLEVRSRWFARRPAYLDFDRIYPRAELNLETNSRVLLVCARRDKGLDLRMVFEFLDRDRAKIRHMMVRADMPQSLAIPENCHFVRLRLRVDGTGRACIARLVLDAEGIAPVAVLATGDRLLVTDRPLAREQPVEACIPGQDAQAGGRTEVFVLREDGAGCFREQDGVDIVEGDAALLERIVRSGAYSALCFDGVDPARFGVADDARCPAGTEGI